MKFEKKRILVIGDVMLDIYRCGEVIGLSQESPTPKFVEENTTYCIGAAGNVAVNLKQLGMEVYLIGAVGDDEHGKHLRWLLREYGIKKQLRDSVITTVKTRWMDLNRQLFRTDSENRIIDPEERYNIAVAVTETCTHGDFDAIIISDYGKGVVSDEVMAVIPDNLFIAIDPYPGNAKLYPEANLITPNGIEHKHLQNNIKSELRLITKASLGMDIVEFDARQSIGAECQAPVCVVGAGDVVIACATVALLNGFEPIDAAMYANQEAGIAVGKPFTSVIDAP